MFFSASAFHLFYTVSPPICSTGRTILRSRSETTTWLGLVPLAWWPPEPQLGSLLSPHTYCKFQLRHSFPRTSQLPGIVGHLPFTWCSAQKTVNDQARPERVSHHSAADDWLADQGSHTLQITNRRRAVSESNAPCVGFESGLAEVCRVGTGMDTRCWGGGGQVWYLHNGRGERNLGQTTTNPPTSHTSIWWYHFTTRRSFPLSLVFLCPMSTRNAGESN